MIKRLFSRMTRRLAGLTRRQRHILGAIYAVYADEILVNELFEYLQENEPGLVDSPAELYYRLRHLEGEGLIQMEALGRESTKIVALAEVRRALDSSRP